MKPAAGQRDWWLRALCVALLLVAAVLAYRSALHNAFVWDSKHYLLPNEAWLASLAPSHLWWMLTSLEMSNWHPLTWLSWALDYRLYGGLEPAGFHLTSLVIHGLNAGLLFLVILAVFGIRENRSQERLLSREPVTIGAALGAALMFAVHPQHVESVAWVAERKDLLCQFFMLLTVLAWFRHVTASDRRGRWYVVALLCALLAAMSKPMAVSLPVILLLLDAWPLGRLSFSFQTPPERLSAWRLLVEKWPFIAIAAGLVVVTMVAQSGAMAVVPLDIRVLNAFNSYLAYLSKWLLPLSLSPHYPFFTTPDLGIQARHWVPVMGFLGISGAALLLWVRGQRFWLVAWAVYVVTLLPVIGLVSVGTQGMADRYTYFPMVALYVLVAGGLRALMGRGRIFTITALLATLGICTALAMLTGRQVGFWKDEISLWSQAVRTFPTDGTARNNLGLALLQVGAYEQALAQFDIVERLPYRKTRLQAMRAYSLMRLGRYAEAMEALDRLEASAPHEPEVPVDWDCYRYDRGWILARLGRTGEAIGLLSKVDAGSAWRPSALTWREHLEHNPDGAASAPEFAGLPDFCPMLVPVSWHVVSD